MIIRENGDKERILELNSPELLRLLQLYCATFSDQISLWVAHHSHGLSWTWGSSIGEI